MHGAKGSYTKAGDIGGLYSFMTTLRKLVKTYGITKCILFWDGANSGFYRYKIDRCYKANRDKEWRIQTTLNEAQAELLQKEKAILQVQKQKVQQYAEELYIRQIEVEKIEADDLIAYYIMEHQKDEDMILYTNDRDYVQLLDYGVSIHYDNFEYPVSSGNYFMFFPYHYKNALTVKILLGDDSDNIPGIEGLGMGTLLKHFPEIKTQEFKVRDVLLKTKQLSEARGSKKPLKVFTNLLNGIERLKTNYELMNLSQPILTDEALEALEELEMPLAESDEQGNKRGSQNLLKLIERDDFLSLYSNQGNFVSYVEPFYTIITTEKQTLKKFLSEGK
jgi:5'-3' exonuclease